MSLIEKAVDRSNPHGLPVGRERKQGSATRGRHARAT